MVKNAQQRRNSAIPKRHPRRSAARPGDPGKTKIPYFHLDPRMSHALTACSSEDDIPLSPSSSNLSIALPYAPSTSGELSAAGRGWDREVCCAAIFLCGVQKKYIKRKITSLIPLWHIPHKKTPGKPGVKKTNHSSRKLP